MLNKKLKLPNKKNQYSLRNNCFLSWITDPKVSFYNLHQINKTIQSKINGSYSYFNQTRKSYSKRKSENFFEFLNRTTQKSVLAIAKSNWI